MLIKHIHFIWFLIFLKNVSSEEDWLIWDKDESPKFDYPCDHVIFCQSTADNSIIFVCASYCGVTLDPVSYSGVRLLTSPEIVLEKSKKLISDHYGKNKDVAVKAFSKFFNDHFAFGGELDHWTPMDFTTVSRFITMIENKNVRAFATTILTIWPSLGYKVAENITDNPDRHSMIPIPNGFIAAANDSTEWRYLDSYLILEGVLISRMLLTAQGMLDNIVFLLEKYGYVPFKSRVNYLDRSGPPVFTKMVALYVNKTGDLMWVRRNIDIVAKEMEYWKANRFTTITVKNKQYKFAQYKVRSKGLRMNNLRGDFDMTEMVKKYRGMHANELKSAAESGWEFSSRWIFNKDLADGPIDGRHGHPRYSNLSRIIPVDLNAIIYGAFDELANLYTKIGRHPSSISWREDADTLLDAIQNVLWNETDGSWYDYDIEKNEQRAFFYASNIVPLWTRAYPKSSIPEVRAEIGERVVDYLVKEEIPQFQGGIPASTFLSEEEFDFPNVWPSSQMMIIDGLRDAGDGKPRQLAEQFATRFLQTTFICYRKSKTLIMNYDATTPGSNLYIHKKDRPLLQRYGYGATNAAILSIMHSFVFPYGTLISCGGSLSTTFLIVIIPILEYLYSLW